MSKALRASGAEGDFRIIIDQPSLRLLILGHAQPLIRLPVLSPPGAPGITLVTLGRWPY